MSNSCCAGGEKCTKSSSCSMILRSACVHKREQSSTVGDFHTHISNCSDQNINFEKDNANGTTLLTSQLEESIKRLTLNSFNKIYSFSQNTFSDTRQSTGETAYKSIGSSTANSYLTTDLNHFSGFSVFSNPSEKENSLAKEQCSYYSSGTESELNKSQSDISKTVSKMPRTPSRRTSVSSIRALSGSESEDETTLLQGGQQLERRSRSAYSMPSHSFSGRRHNVSETSRQSHNSSSSRSSFQPVFNEHSNQYLAEELNHRTPINESLPPSVSTYYGSAFEWFRWLLWRWTYLKICTVMNVDLWLLSRIFTIGKNKVILTFILIPLLIWILCGMYSTSVLLTEENQRHETNSFFQYAKSYMRVNYMSESDTKDTNSRTFFIPSLSGISNIFSSLFQKDDEDLLSERVSSIQPEPAYHSSKEEIKSLALEVWKEEADELLKNFNMKNYQENTNHYINEDKNENNMQNEIADLQREFLSLSGVIKGLQVYMQEKVDGSKKMLAIASEQGIKLQHLDTKIKHVEKKLEHLMISLKDCCSKQWGESDLIQALEKHLSPALKNVISNEASRNKSYSFFHDWLDSKFVLQKDLTSKINAAFQTLRKDSAKLDEETYAKNANKEIESIVLQYLKSLKSDLSTITGFASSSEQIRLESHYLDDIKTIIKEAIMLYDADKTGLVDYALESGGGSILGTKCSETYIERNARVSVFGLPLWHTSNSPRTAIQPNVQPGDCWAFKGNQGFLVIQLSATIRPTGFTLEHIPLSLSPTGTIDSAPKDFSVWGLTSEKDGAGKLLGRYTYDVNGEPLQYFPVQEANDGHFSFVELKVHRNNGNLEYTCLYRFRVHGIRFKN